MPLFLISVDDSMARAKLRDAARALSAGWDDRKEFNKDATHFVCDRLKRSEKLLCAIASRLWVLHPQHLFARTRSRDLQDRQRRKQGHPPRGGLRVGEGRGRRGHKRVEGRSPAVAAVTFAAVRRVERWADG